MAPPSSDIADNGSVELETDSAATLRTSYTQSTSDPASHDAEKVLRDWASSETLRTFLDDPISASMQYGHPSKQEAVEDHRQRMKQNLWRFEEMMADSEKNAELLPVYHHLPLNIFPVRDRVPGEQLPFRLIDGVTSTQPLRSICNGSHADTPSTSVYEAEPGGQPPEPHPEYHHSEPAASTCAPSLLPWMPDPLIFNDSSKGKGKVPPKFGTHKDQTPLQSTDVEEQKQFVANESMSSSRPVQEQTSFQSLGQLCNSSPNSFHMHQSSVNTNELSSVLLPNNTIWHPQQNLFLHSEQPQPPHLDPNSWHGWCSSAENSNTSFKSQLPASSAGLPTTNAAPVPAQTTSRHETNFHSQEDNSDIGTKVPSLTSNSSSSQPHSSPVDSSGNISNSPPSHETQPQEHVAPSGILHMWHQETPQGGEAGEKGEGEDEEWMDLVDLDADPHQAS